jgi:hypothetical protein
MAGESLNAAASASVFDRGPALTFHGAMATYGQMHTGGSRQIAVLERHYRSASPAQHEG